MTGGHVRSLIRVLLLAVAAVRRRPELLRVAAWRVAAGILLLVGASFVIYATVRSAPGDAVDAISPMGTPPEIKAQLTAEFGLDRDVVTGYAIWLGRSVTGDFGESLVVAAGETVMGVALPAFRRTFLLSSLALLACVALSLLGALMLGAPSPTQQWVTSTLYFFTSAPAFLVALFFAAAMNWGVREWVERAGYETPIWYPIPIYSESLMPYLFAGAVLIVGDGLFMDFLNVVRSELSALRASQFITAVKAKGATTARHIARNLVVPIASAYAARLPIVLGGVVIVEYVFTLDGGGYLLLEAARERDFPVVVGLSVFFTLTIIAMNTLADLIGAFVDPREAARGG